MGAVAKIEKGQLAVENLARYKVAKRDGAEDAALSALTIFNENKQYLGYGYLKTPEEAVPPVGLTFYSFHIMVALGSLFPLVFLAYLFFIYKDTLPEKRWLLVPGVTMFLLGLIASQAGWVVAEVGRQPWAIEGLLPVTIARSNLTAGTVQATFYMFLILFTILLIAEIKIMAKQISIGPEGN